MNSQFFSFGAVRWWIPMAAGTVFAVLTLVIVFPLLGTRCYPSPTTASMSQAKALGETIHLYLADFDQRLPFPGDYRGGVLGMAGSPAWVIAGRSEFTGSNSPPCEIPGPVDFCSMADPESGSLKAYLPPSSKYFAPHIKGNTKFSHVLGEQKIEERRFRCGFSMNAALGPLVESQFTIRPFSLLEIQKPESRILLAVESPRTATGGRFHPGLADAHFPMSELKDLSNTGSGVILYADSRVSRIQISDYAYQGPNWSEFGWNERLSAPRSSIRGRR